MWISNTSEELRRAVVTVAGRDVNWLREIPDLSANEATYQQWLQSGILRTIRVPTETQPQYVKVVVYDYGSDRIGSVMTKIK